MKRFSPAPFLASLLMLACAASYAQPYKVLHLVSGQTQTLRLDPFAVPYADSDGLITEDVTKLKFDGSELTIGDLGTADDEYFVPIWANEDGKLEGDLESAAVVAATGDWYFGWDEGGGRISLYVAKSAPLVGGTAGTLPGSAAWTLTPDLFQIISASLSGPAVDVQTLAGVNAANARILITQNDTQAGSVPGIEIRGHDNAMKAQIELNGTISTVAQIVSTLSTGTAPLSVASTTKVTNLNADSLDDQTGTYYTNATNLASGTVPTARLGSGTANANSFLAGDQTYKGLPVRVFQSAYTDAQSDGEDPTDFYPYVLPANELGADGQRLRWLTRIDIVAGVLNEKTVAMNVGAFTLPLVSAEVTPADVSLRIETEIIRSAAGTQRIEIKMDRMVSGVTATFFITMDATEDLTATVPIHFTGTVTDLGDGDADGQITAKSQLILWNAGS